MGDDPRYRKWQKPLEAAEVCDAARFISEGQYDVISFSRGLLTIACVSSAQAANLQTESEGIMAKINQKIGREAVQKLRFKITQ